MSAARRPARSRTARTAAVAAGLLLLTGCGSGLRAQTYQQRTVAEATNDAVGNIAVLNLAVLAPEEGTVHEAGSDVPMTVTLVNKGRETDVLQRVTTDAAARVDVVGPSKRFEVPRLDKSDASYSLVLRDLTRELNTSEYIEMTLSFERNGSKSMLVPVKVTNEPVDEGDEYKVAETDSAGEPIVEEEQRPELDTDGGEAPEGDAVPESGSDPKGDNDSDTAEPPPSE